MCGGAIISGFIPPSASSRRVTAGNLWPHLSKGKSYGSEKKLGERPTVDIEDDDDVDFEADFQEFKDEQEEEFDAVEVFDAKPLSFPSKSAPPKGITSFCGYVNWVFVVKIEFFFFGFVVNFVVSGNGFLLVRDLMGFSPILN